MSRSRYKIFEEEYPYFLTSTVVAWLPLFSQPWTVDILYDSFRWLQKERQVSIFGYVIMENHLHWIAQAPELAKTVGKWKSFLARRFVDGLEERGRKTLLDEFRHYKLRHKQNQEYQVWQEGDYPKQIKDDEMMLQKLEYMHHNPIRRGYVDQAEHWRHSSARNYLGMPGLVEVITSWN